MGKTVLVVPLFYVLKGWFTFLLALLLLRRFYR